MSRKKKSIRYFFYNDELHRSLHVHRGNDTIIAWNYPQGVAKQYAYSMVKRNGEKAFSSSQVQQMLGRSRWAIERAIAAGSIKRPQFSYGIDENRNFRAYFWREQDIMDLHEYFCGVHWGRPRKDGRVTPKKLPSRSELRAMIHQGTVLYVQTEDGEFVPTWEAEKF